MPASVIKIFNGGAGVLNKDDLPDFGLKNPTTLTSAYGPCACGYFAQIGEDDSGRFVALSGLVNPGGLKANLPTGGSAIYEGNTQITVLNRDAAGDALGLAEAKAFSVVVRADFDAGTFRGRTPYYGDKVYQLTFSGAMTGRDLQGKATLKKEGFDVSGPLEGRIDKKIAFAAFHGNNDVDAFAGGFGAAVPNP